VESIAPRAVNNKPALFLGKANGLFFLPVAVGTVTRRRWPRVGGFFFFCSRPVPPNWRPTEIAKRATVQLHSNRSREIHEGFLCLSCSPASLFPPYNGYSLRLT
jgi:hypothetical protein